MGGQCRRSECGVAPFPSAARGWQSPFSNSRALKRNSRATEGGGESEKRGQRVDESVTKYFNKASENGMMGEGARYYQGGVRMEGRFRGAFHWQLLKGVYM